jgi:hypothetical protein
MTDYTGFLGGLRYYRDKALDYLSLPSYKAPTTPPLPSKQGDNNMLGDPNASVPELGKGAFNTKAALTPVVTDIINSALGDKALTAKADALLGAFGMPSQTAIKDFQVEFFKKVFEATTNKFGPVNNPNPRPVTHAALNAMIDLTNQNNPSAIRGFFEKKGGGYQLTADGIKGLAEPTAGYILKPRPIPGIDDNNAPANQAAPAATPKTPAAKNTSPGLLDQIDPSKAGTGLLDQLDARPARKPAIAPKH